MTLSDVINRLYALGRYSLERMAHMAECSVGTITRVRDDVSDPAFSKGARLSRAVMADSGETAIAQICCADGWHVVKRAEASPDGCMLRERADMESALCDVQRAFDAGRYDDASMPLRTAYEILDRIAAEVDAKLRTQTH